MRDHYNGMNKFLILFLLATFVALFYPPVVAAQSILGTAEDFAVIGHTGVTNTGPTVISGGDAAVGNLGNYEAGGANAISGFDTDLNTFHGPGTFTDGPGIVEAPAAIHGGDAVAMQARNDFWTAYIALSALPVPPGNDLTGQDLGNYNTSNLGALAPGVYSFDTSVDITGTLQLDAQNINGAYWVFQIGTTLTAAEASAVELINAGSNNGSDVGVFWLVGSSATLNTSTAFEGNIIAEESISMLDSATIYNGRAFAYNGAVTLINNTISNVCPPGSSSPNDGPGFSGGLEFDENGDLVPVGNGGNGDNGGNGGNGDNGGAPVPEPATMLLFGSGLIGLVGFRKKFKKA